MGTAERWRVAAALVAVVPALAACGSGESAAPTTGRPSQAVTAPVTPQPPLSSRAAPPYVALPRRQPAPAVLVLHPWWGLNGDVRAYADSLASAGFVALAPDLYGDGSIATSVEQAEGLAAAHSADEMAERARVGLTTLLQRPEVSGKTAAVVGFSLGGHAADALATGPDAGLVAALVLYYDADPSLRWDRLRAPVLVHQAEDDPYTDPDDVLAMRQAITRGGGQCQVIRYAATSHWFAEPHRPEFEKTAARRAATRTVAFLNRSLRG